MTERDLKNITGMMMESGTVEPYLLRSYLSYILQNCDAVEEKSLQCGEREPEDRLCFQRRVPTPDEIELMRRIEEAKKNETFSERLIRLIKESGKTSPEVYRAAGVDYRHFSKINSNRNYRPSKETVSAFALALHLSLKDAEELMEKAGFAFSSASIFDVTIRFFLENRYYDRRKIDLIMENMGIPLMPQNF